MKIPLYRSITVYPKVTAANTQYWEMTPESQSYVFEHLVRYQSNMAEVCTAHSGLRTDYYRKRTGTWPRGRLGANSDASITGGIINQLLQGHDLTTTHLDAVEVLFVSIAQMYSDSGVLPVKFNRQLFRFE